ncbi:hypothetical protein KL918_000328 [Ogataea parapolymorpha]|uniref:Uncharacterized protein n=1 Tax=Ogataea parapolymorpha (strain ATCC 26012 / BCRC 20466 / JCM 22074 / NRRL Y-7560 / DL-1) TaxID=871575 RepID=W1QAJ5_OGAPD|nr:hypothetical protein HPODL_03001 [Ogataea parapolymorpha DL-1]ESW96375.1 hypothetical protein HPODL_03001 [Ogataea parapolymorpha DL-1]KAG7870124.1 hypothetical protein KL918_000328 [Ogataea parapolymorpha]KAG7875073.1 hypothetical protein KL916_000685 [Ogataea parapolymorpha]
MPQFYHFGFDKAPNLEGSKALDRIKRSHKKAYDLEQADLRPLRFPNFISLRDIVSISGFDTVTLHGSESKDGGSTLTSLEEYSQFNGENYEFKHYITLNLFHDDTDPIKSLLTVGVEGLPECLIHSNYLTDDLLTYTMNELLTSVPVKVNDESVHLNTKFSWTALNNDIINSKIIFIEFHDLLTLYLFDKVVNSENIKVRLKQTARMACEKLAENIEITEIDSSKFNERLSQIEKHEALRKRGTQTVNGQGQVYMVDPKDLEDVPPDMLDLVKQNVINFRMRVLYLESQKKQQQMIRDKQLSKMKLRRMLPARNDRNEDESDEELQDDGIDDEEFKKQQETQAQTRAEKTFLMRIQQTRKRDEARLKSIEAFHKNIEHHAYETEYVVNARKRFLDSFVSGIKDASNKIDQNFSYYVNHSNYLAFRSKKKQDEERMDAIDRDEEAKERDATAEQDEFMASFTSKPVKISLRKKEEAPTLSEDQVDKVRRKAEEVLEEFLGVREESLVDFIVSFVSNNYHRGTDNEEYRAFVSELAETLDEDAETAVDQVYKCIT